METGGVADTLLSGACVIFTLGMFSTGLSDLRHMWMTRRVDNIQFLPFLTTDVNNLSWLSYGTLKRDGTLIIVNAVGAVLQTSYILVYLHYCPRKVGTLPCTHLFCSMSCLLAGPAVLPRRLEQAGTVNFSWKAPPALQSSFLLNASLLILTHGPLSGKAIALLTLMRPPCCPIS
ncbi:solute carrier family 50 member 1 [Phyllostomus discolor]|uniref:Sugar transporter SWEET1 n=1 Tax=Phyllostomus discolor TaxID=89673 RepID=A0A833YAV0_9CHIR|nr:solute carrier family 50 member 1 [Phyllostomus discolor]